MKTLYTVMIEYCSFIKYIVTNDEQGDEPSHCPALYWHCYT